MKYILKYFLSISILLFFVNFTLSPLLWNSTFYEKVADERSDSESSEMDGSEKEYASKLFFTNDDIFFSSLARKKKCFSSAEQNFPSVFIELSIQPPE